MSGNDSSTEQATDKEQREAAKLQAKIREQQGVFAASLQEPAEPAKDGVVAPINRDAATGRWLPGYAPNPGGRPSAKRERAIIDALNARVNPETVADVVYGLMTHPNSWRANAAGIDWYGKYMLGPAPARSPERENVIDVILAKMRESAGR